jgi:hypothetical protein
MSEKAVWAGRREAPIPATKEPEFEHIQAMAAISELFRRRSESEGYHV